MSEKNNFIPNQLEVNVLLNNLKKVIKTRLLAINENIRTIRKRKNFSKDELNHYKELRNRVQFMLNKITNLLNKGIFTMDDFQKLKESFMKTPLPDINKNTNE